MAVQDAARAAGIKGAAMAVLSYLCTSSAFKTPTVRRCKETICLQTGYGITAVKAALARLRAEGIIEPVACFEGGRNRATVYKLRTKAQNGYGNDTPNDETAEKGYGKRQKGVWKTAQRGMETNPPSISSSISSSRREKGRGLDAPDAAAHAASAPDAGVAADRQAIAQIMQAERCGYGRARDLLDARRRVQAGDLP